MFKNSLIVLLLFTLATTAVFASKTVYCNHPDFGLSPYTWHIGSSKTTPFAEAVNPGAYFRTCVTGTTKIELTVDGTRNEGVGGEGAFEYSIDGAPFVEHIFEPINDFYNVSLAEGLDPAEEHTVEVYFRYGDLTHWRWTRGCSHFAIKGLVIDVGGQIKPFPKRKKLALGFGDSITEGVGSVGKYVTLEDLKVNSARETWFPIACEALDCEYGQVGSGGHGMLQDKMEIPALYQSWGNLDKDKPRLKGGKLVPEPDYVFCNMGTNDFESRDDLDINLEEAYLIWIAQVRKAAPTSYIFCVIPPNGKHRTVINEVVKKCGDKKTFIIDTPRLNRTIWARSGVTAHADDGVHPNQAGHALFGATVAVEAMKIIKDFEK